MSPEPKAKTQLEWDSLNAELIDQKQKTNPINDFEIFFLDDKSMRNSINFIKNKYSQKRDCE